MRLIMSAILLTAVFGGFQRVCAIRLRPPQFLPEDGIRSECAYETMAQCEAAKRGSGDFCEPNSAPMDHPVSRSQGQ